MSAKHELKKLHEDIEKHIEKIKDYKVSYTREKTNLGYKYIVNFDRLLKDQKTEENENPTWQKHWDKKEAKTETKKKSTCKTCNKH